MAYGALWCRSRFGVLRHGVIRHGWRLETRHIQMGLITVSGDTQRNNYGVETCNSSSRIWTPVSTPKNPGCRAGCRVGCRAGTGTCWRVPHSLKPPLIVRGTRIMEVKPAPHVTTTQHRARAPRAVTIQQHLPYSKIPSFLRYFITLK